MSAQQYYLEVVKDGQDPEWPVPEEQLVIGSQPLEGGYTQFWAYPKDGAPDPQETPQAENLAKQYLAAQPTLLVHQVSKQPPLIELLITSKGHAWARTETSLANLEDNIHQLLDFAKKRFNIDVEGFMTTKDVSPEVEKKMDEMESGEGGTSPEEPITPKMAEAKEEPEEELDPLDDESVEDEPEAPEEEEEVIHTTPQTSPLHDEAPEPPHEPIDDVPPAHKGNSLDSLLEEREEEPVPQRSQSSSIRPVSSYGITQPLYANGSQSSSGGSKKWLFLPLGVLLVAAGLVYMYRDSIGEQLQSYGVATASPSPSPVAEASPSPTPSPEPEIAREDYKVRVLNGTLQSGYAGKLADMLKEKGWQIDKTGNATNSATPTSYIRSKPASVGAINALIKDLSGEIQAASSSSALKSTDTADLEVVIGKE